MTHLPVKTSGSSIDSKKLETAVSILSTSFGQWHLGENQAALSNVAEGKENALPDH